MNHHGAVLLVVGTRIFELETLWQVVIHLDGTQLPTATQCVLNHEVEFRTIECGLTQFCAGGESFLCTCLDDSILGLFPHLVRTDVLFLVVGVAERNLCLEVLEVECLEDDADDVHHAQELILHLVGAAEDVGIVLSERTHTGQSVQLARLLIAIHGAELGAAEGEVLVRAWLPGKNLAVVRAVHGLEQILFTFFGCVDGLERVLAIVGIVARSHIEVLSADVWSDNLLIAISLLDFTQEVL